MLRRESARDFYYNVSGGGFGARYKRAVIMCQEVFVEKDGRMIAERFGLILGDFGYNGV